MSLSMAWDPLLWLQHFFLKTQGDGSLRLRNSLPLEIRQANLVCSFFLSFPQSHCIVFSFLGLIFCLGCSFYGVLLSMLNFVLCCIVVTLLWQEMRIIILLISILFELLQTPLTFVSEQEKRKIWSRLGTTAWRGTRAQDGQSPSGPEVIKCFRAGNRSDSLTLSRMSSFHLRLDLVPSSQTQADWSSEMMAQAGPEQQSFICYKSDVMFSWGYFFPDVKSNWNIKYLWMYRIINWHKQDNICIWGPCNVWIQCDRVPTQDQCIKCWKYLRLKVLWGHTFSQEQSHLMLRVCVGFC